MNHCIFGKVCERIVLTTISGEYSCWKDDKKKYLLGEQCNYLLAYLFLILSRDSICRKQNLLIQLSYTSSKHHGHLDSLWTHALQAYSTGMVSRFTWMARKVIFDCQNTQKLRNCLPRLILCCVFLIQNSIVAAPSEDM